VPQVVRALVGIQAQDRRAAALAVRPRTPGASAEAVERALSEERSVVRTWAMRGTLHLLAADDLPAMLAIFGALHIRRGERRLTQLGLPPDVAERSTAAAGEILAADGPLTRHELAERLRARGVPVAAEGQAPIAVAHRAALAGVLCETGVRGREELYGRIDPGPLPDRDAALADLARRYVAAYAPADAADFAAWSGLPAADVIRAWDAAGDDPPATDHPGAGPVRLLPAFNEWLLEWASRDGVVAEAHARRVAPGGGIVRPVAIEDGHVFATWRLDRPKRRIEVDSFARLTRSQQVGLETETAAVSEFLGLDLSLIVLLS
jgi:Winged helix DNA-binding domain